MRLREIMKPNLKVLGEEISCKSKEIPAFSQIPMKFTPRDREFPLDTIWKSFSKFVSVSCSSLLGRGGDDQCNSNFW